MEFERTKIEDVIVVKPQVFEDERGFFKETYRESVFAENGIRDRFVQDNFSMSQYGTIRGLHYQVDKPQAKLIMVTKGRVLDVAVDVRTDSPTFGEFVEMELSGDNHRMLYIPVGFAHGFAVLSDEAIFQYKCSDYYYPKGERGIFWDDPGIGIEWPIDDPTISDKDTQLPRLSEMSKEDLF